MKPVKLKKEYLIINIPILALFLILFISPILIKDRTSIYYIGITDRIIFGVWCVFNGIWNAATDYYSFLKDIRFNKNKQAPKWAWWLVFVIGVWCIVTALMGFGFNGVQKPI